MAVAFCVFASCPITGIWCFGRDGDFDFDVDLADYLALLACVNGSGVPAVGDCRRFDLDRDGDVDLGDVVAVQAAFTGAR